MNKSRDNYLKHLRKLYGIFGDPAGAGTHPMEGWVDPEFISMVVLCGLIGTILFKGIVPIVIGTLPSIFW